MGFSRERMLALSQARDPAADGRFVTGVLSTGIYCLPSCKARSPKPENVRFFARPEDARAAGLRPCKRCRPDDFYRRRDPDREAVEALAERLRSVPGELPTLEALVAASRLRASKLHRLFRLHFHSTPARLAQRLRVAAACSRLLATRRAVSEVAFDVGFESLSAFGDNFRRRTGMSAGDYRRLLGARSFEVQLPRAYPAAAVLAHLGRDPVSRSERVRGAVHESGVWLAGRPARLRVELAAGRACCSITGAGLADTAAAEAHAIVLRRLGLGWETGGFERRMARLPALARLLERTRGLRVPLTATRFDALTWAIIGQQINLPFAFRLQNVLAELAGTPVGDGLSAPPRASEVAGLGSGPLIARQYSRSKADYLIGAAELVAAGDLDLEALARGSAVVLEERLLAVRGIGAWTARYVMMRGFGLEDCVPVGDAALVRGLQGFFHLPDRPDVRRTEELMEPFRPYRSLATFHLWKSLEIAA